MQELMFSEVLSGFKSYLIESTGTTNTADAYIPKIRDTFVLYLESKKIEGQSLSDFLERSVDTPMIAESTVEYLKKTQIEGQVSESAINNYLIAVKQLFVYLERIHVKNTNILSLLMEDVQKSQRRAELLKLIESGVQREGIELVPLQKDPPIKGEELQYLLQDLDPIKMEGLDLSKPQSYSKLQQCIMIKLFILLGLKPQKLYDIRICDYDLEHNQIVIPSANIKNGILHYRITLPNALHDQIKKLILYKLENGYTRSDLLLSKSTGTPVDQTYIVHYLKTVREGYEEYVKDNGKESNNYSEGNNTFTQTGLQKYGLIQMLKTGIDPTIIRELSNSSKDNDSNGFKDDILDNCQDYVLSEEPNRSRYLDSHIRAIPTFDDL